MNNLISCLFLPFIFSTACSTGEAPALPEGKANVSARIEEVPWEATTFESALNVVPGKGQFFELRGAGGAYVLHLSVLEFDNPTGIISEGPYVESDNFFLRLMLVDEEGEPLAEYRPVFNGAPADSQIGITITASSNSRISGSFSGMLHKVPQEEDEYPSFLMLSDGNFSNLDFETRTVNIQ